MDTIGKLTINKRDSLKDIAAKLKGLAANSDVPIVTADHSDVKKVLMKDPEMLKWVTYHKEPMSKERFEPIKNESEGLWSKPINGGLWSCPFDNGKDLWASFISDAGITKERMEVKQVFTLKPKSKILMINSNNDLKIMRKSFFNVEFHGRIFFDFEAMAKKYDGLFIRIWQESFCQGTYYYFYSWDVTSLLLFNYDVIDTITTL